MRWLRYALAGGVLVAVGCALGRARRTKQALNIPAGERNAGVEAAMEDQAMARAVSEVNSGEYDMQG
jgi:hypothetical protein